MEATNETVKNHAGAQSRAGEAGANLSVGLCVGVETVQAIGFEWVKPHHFWCGDHCEYPGTIAIKTNAGVLLLARIEKFSTGLNGGIRKVLVKPEELDTADA